MVGVTATIRYILAMKGPKTISELGSLLRPLVRPEEAAATYRNGGDYPRLKGPSTLEHDVYQGVRMMARGAIHNMDKTGSVVRQGDRRPFQWVLTDLGWERHHQEAWLVEPVRHARQVLMGLEAGLLDGQDVDTLRQLHKELGDFLKGHGSRGH